MSQWTHVAGCIRIDSLPFGQDMNAVLARKFGNTCKFNDPEEKWDACNVPCGSEGSVQYNISHTGRPSDIAWGQVCIWGDLRDYKDAQAIFEWLKETCAARDFLIRACIVKIDVEFGDSYLIRDEWDDEGCKLVMEKLITKEQP